jgi:hypothetical protein
MSTAEIETWQIGVERRQRNVSIVAFLTAPRWLQDRQMTEGQLAARARLGSDRWAYWVRRGWDDAGQPTRR